MGMTTIGSKGFKLFWLCAALGVVAALVLPLAVPQSVRA
jgi:hypothetical protein